MQRLLTIFDLTLYIAFMFLVREVYFSSIHFIANGLFWSLSALLVASWLMKMRGVSWRSLGLSKPSDIRKTLTTTAIILAATIGSIIIFEIVKDNLALDLAADTSDQDASSKFGELAGNYLLFFAIIPFVWLESMLEEMLDRAFLISWVERLFSRTIFATIFAVLFQACIFGFRHSYDLSERSLTVGLIGLVMGIAYIACGRKLWPLILAHCALNTMSMLGRV